MSSSPLPSTASLSRSTTFGRYLGFCLVSLLLLTDTFAANREKKSFDVSAGDAVRSLRVFSEQSGEQIIFPVEQVRGVKTNAVKGQFTAPEALDRLLAGTVLMAEMDQQTGALAVRKGVPDPKAARATPLPSSARPADSAPASANAPAAAADDTIVLSPFTVDANQDEGSYQATQTLNGTRLRTDIKDIGSAMTIFTEQMMDDLGATNINDIMTFAPNTDPFVASTGDTAGNGNDFINVGNQQFVTRGGSSSVVSQDFFGTNVPNDRFNVERITFTRGPNSILFGLGNASGAVATSTKQARTNKDATTVAYVIDQRGSYRGTLDHNQVLKKKLLAFRYSGVYEALNTFRKPTENFQRRHFMALKVTPFGDKTTLRFNYEQGLVNVPAVRPWPIYDAVTPWILAGKPIIPTFTNNATNPAKPVGVVNYTTTLTSTEFSRAGTRIPTQNLANTGQTAKPTFTLAGFPANTFVVNGANLRSLIDESIYPTFASSFGNTALILHDYKTHSIFLEQNITRHLDIEIAYNSLDNSTIRMNGIRGQDDFLYADPNAQLPNGQPNPNVGMYYVEAQTTRIDSPSSSDAVRVTASYNLDFRDAKRQWMTYLGRHQIALFNEQTHASDWSSNNVLRNVTTPGATTGIVYRYYVDPAKGVVGMGAASNYLQYPVLYAGVTPPTPNLTTGITPAFQAQQGLNASANLVKTFAFATQSFLWKDKLVFTTGMRKDDNTAWRGIPQEFDFLTDANGYRPGGAGINVRKLLPNNRRERGGNTNTRGLVFHAMPWLSLTYNSSSNLNINDSTVNRYGDLLPNPSGEGKDYGLKMEFFDRKLFFEAVYYTNSNKNASENIINGTWGDFGQINTIWNAIAALPGNEKYANTPYFFAQRLIWNDAVSRTSKGWEFSLTARPLKGWQMVFNGSKRGNQTATDRGIYITQYINEFFPEIKANPQWMSLVVGSSTVAQLVNSVETTLANFKLLESLPANNFAPSWTFNTIQSYNFSGALKGFSIGATANARGRSIAGFQVDDSPNRLLVPSKPYYSPGYTNYGARIGYQRKLFNGRVNWTLQLNITNLLDENTIYPVHIVDRRDGTHLPTAAVYGLREPRTYRITNTFRF